MIVLIVLPWSLSPCSLEPVQLCTAPSEAPIFRQIVFNNGFEAGKLQNYVTYFVLQMEIYFYNRWIFWLYTQTYCILYTKQ